MCICGVSVSLSSAKYSFQAEEMHRAQLFLLCAEKKQQQLQHQTRFSIEQLNSKTRSINIIQYYFARLQQFPSKSGQM